MNKKAKIGWIVLGSCTGVVLIVSVFLFALEQRELTIKYNTAVKYAEQGAYEQAEDLISKMGSFKNSESLATQYKNEIDYQQAAYCYSVQDYDGALELFTKLAQSSYKDSATLCDEIKYEKGRVCEANGELKEAYKAFKDLPLSYKDVMERIEELTYPIRFDGLWYSKEYQMDLLIEGRVDDENHSYVDVELRDRNGELTGNTDNRLSAKNIPIVEDKFMWDIFNNGTKYTVTYDNNKLTVTKPTTINFDGTSTDTFKPVVFVRQLVEENLDKAVDASVDNVK